ncbi:MAG: ABC transporter substrate-binding protein [Mycobacteriales bacterium]
MQARTTRRTFLYGSALVAGAVSLEACSSKSSTKGAKPAGGGATTSGGPSAPGGSSHAGAVSKAPTSSKDLGATQGSHTQMTVPAKFNEPEALKPEVTAGRLPPVGKRLPATPYVMPHKWVKAGKYGGVLNMYTFSSQGTAKADSNREFFYGHSILRWLNDGLDIVGGLAEKWSSNRDASVWTFKFRPGLKWSDGTDWSTDDILFWWEDIVLPGHDAQTPPADCRSGKGTVAKITAPDKLTLRIAFDSPAPVTGDHLATYVNGALGRNGPAWMHPKHYLKAFHPKYNKSVPKSWDTVGGLWERKADWMQNPDCPTMNGFKTKSFSAGSGVVLERNPYYYAVMPNGDQLPYLDTVNIATVQDANVGKLGLQQGKYDFCMGYFGQIALSDVQTLQASKDKAQTEVLLWDSGSGTGSIFFLNYDYPDDEIRSVFRDKRFRQALSHGFNRADANKSLYFNLAEPTTGIQSPKSQECVASAEGKTMCQQWRDSYKTYDVDKANGLLDSVGMKKGGNGHRTLPSGKKFVLNLDYSSDISTTEAAKDDQLVSDWKKIGINARRNPITPQAYGDMWTAGKLMSHTNWECSGAPNHLVQATWLLPLESSRWSPLEGAYYTARGTSKEKSEQNVDPWKRNPPRIAPEKGGPIAKLWDIYAKAIVEPDEMKRTKYVFEIIKVHISDGPFFQGTAENFPQVVIAKKALQNVPRKESLAQGGYVNPWNHPTPAVYDPETFCWDDPSQHSA